MHLEVQQCLSRAPPGNGVACVAQVGWHLPQEVTLQLLRDLGLRQAPHALRPRLGHRIAQPLPPHLDRGSVQGSRALRTGLGPWLSCNRSCSLCRHLPLALAARGLVSRSGKRMPVQQAICDVSKPLSGGSADGEKCSKDCWQPGNAARLHSASLTSPMLLPTRSSAWATEPSRPAPNHGWRSAAAALNLLPGSNTTSLVSRSQPVPPFCASTCAWRPAA